MNEYILQFSDLKKKSQEILDQFDTLWGRL